ncbi:protein of unknown function [Chitinophaga terrae (ex Kim and Jung 2007)]|uniref:DUF4180 domain-containing protein n=1 Tax=Chitinophaga terrae (ex Kim and Jung 2007) TaxID=408074 RepID=A0A1H4FHQ6_9BACT|nr:DUF4180 domain-containing protein [Chitinophaga terrae (ex Kim and Jung 2007)]MDQ0105338.1 hypothetical protein [Chitinophaga terrae (ex Kim and Jung 2007)]GEP92364.1 hypothetical protein CTE07_40090 [Chitinophaga terrae (ex Kim and Jung 2007)]SEA96022.1 protein of unknown function [Chitinophaga terrae (ex Kim and Jung 2007)]
MDIRTIKTGNSKIAEVISDGFVIETADDGLDILGNLGYQDFDKIIIHEKNITPAFFELKTGLAGEILQKFSTYRVRLAIVGDFVAYAGSKSLRDFIYESNKRKQVNFVPTIEEAINVLSS